MVFLTSKQTGTALMPMIKLYIALDSSFGEELPYGIVNIMYDIKLQVFQPLSKLSIILQMVRVTIHALLCQGFHTKLDIFILVRNCQGEPGLCCLTILPQNTSD